MLFHPGQTGLTGLTHKLRRWGSKVVCSQCLSHPCPVSVNLGVESLSQHGEEACALPSSEGVTASELTQAAKEKIHVHVCMCQSIEKRVDPSSVAFWSK